MELVKKNIHMDRVKGRAETQITLEDDVNISDSRPDVGKLIYDKAEVVFDEIKVTDDHVTVKGKLNFAVLYLTEGESPVPADMEGSLPFEEQVYMEGVQSGDSVNVRWDLEDLTVGLINSRKLSVQALISLKLLSEMMYDEETAVDLYHEEPVEYRKKPLKIAQMTVKKKDIFRIREELTLPQNLPNIVKILWSSICVNHVEFKPLEEKLSVQGEVNVFFLYEGEGEELSIRSFGTIVPFNGTIDCHGCNEGMAADIACSVGHQEVEIRPDFDGEERIFFLELVLDLDISLYEEERLEILSGVYGVVKEVEAVSRPAAFPVLLAKAENRVRLTEKMTLRNADAHMMQLLHSEAQIRIDSGETQENAIRVRGVLDVKALYLSSDSRIPYGSVKGTVPFECTLEAPGMNDGCYYQIRAGIEQLNVAMMDSDELEVKAALILRAVVFEKRMEDIVTDVTVSELDMNKLSGLPGIVIYIARESDSLWDVGKKYYVPISQIKETNDMTTEEIKPGDKLLIVKGLMN